MVAMKHKLITGKRAWLIMSEISQGVDSHGTLVVIKTGS